MSKMIKIDFWLYDYRLKIVRIALIAHHYRRTQWLTGDLIGWRVHVNLSSTAVAHLYQLWRHATSQSKQADGRA